MHEITKDREREVLSLKQCTLQLQFITTLLPVELSNYKLHSQQSLRYLTLNNKCLQYRRAQNLVTLIRSAIEIKRLIFSAI